SGSGIVIQSTGWEAQPTWGSRSCVQVMNRMPWRTVLQSSAYLVCRSRMRTSSWLLSSFVAVVVLLWLPLWGGERLFANEKGSEDTVTTNTNSVAAQSKPETERGIKGLERRPEDDFQIRVHTNAPVESTSSTNLSAKAEKSFRWDVT